MERSDEYRPDPPSGIGYADFRAARARFLARVAAQSEIARLERAFELAWEAPRAHSTLRRVGRGPVQGTRDP